MSCAACAPIIEPCPVKGRPRRSRKARDLSPGFPPITREPCRFSLLPSRERELVGEGFVGSCQSHCGEHVSIEVVVEVKVPGEARAGVVVLFPGTIRLG